MLDKNKYGVVYTPNSLSDFVASILVDEWYSNNRNSLNQYVTVLDPACGEGILLLAAKKAIQRVINKNSVQFYGADIDEDVIKSNNNTFSDENFYFRAVNSLIPTQLENPAEYWSKLIPEISLIIANPPWSSEKQFDKETLKENGYTFYNGQQDVYALFIDLCLRIIQPGGYLAFILPDSMFSRESSTVRKHLIENACIKVIARLGEKLFPGINRATTVLVIQKNTPNTTSTTKCFRLSTQQRKDYLSGKTTLLSIYNDSYHIVNQNRFVNNGKFLFDIDTRHKEEDLLKKYETHSINWSSKFYFGRGVEVGKAGCIVVCQYCRKAQGYSRKQQENGSKKCIVCGQDILISDEHKDEIISDYMYNDFRRVYVGENVHRYAITGCKYLKLGVDGINYKHSILFKSPKLLIRKTGLGINSCIDYDDTYFTQTVYVCHALNPKDIPLSYYMGVLNSRILFFYYLKRYGENEWKSHPYLTKDILFSLPLPEVSNNNREICSFIASISEKLQNSYSRDADMVLERTVAQLYDINEDELDIIINELNKLPNLGAINHMKMAKAEIMQ